MTFPVKTPGDMTRLRISDHFLSSGKDSMFLIDVSFDDGKTWKTVDRPRGWRRPRIFVGRYVTVGDVPRGHARGAGPLPRHRPQHAGA